MKQKPCIIPIASGKGGVGKSIITANLAIALASKSLKIIAVDLDLGGANLYTYLGMKNTYKGIGDFLREKDKLKNFLVPTAYKNLSFLPGEGRTTFLANIHYAQKKKLIKELLNLDADCILLDLGAGTSFNTLDFFNLANNGLIITTFETPGILNTLSFIKNYLFRRIKFAVSKNTLLTQTLNNAYKNSNENEALTIRGIIELISEHNKEMAEEIKNLLRNFKPRIVFNQGDSKDELKMLDSIEKAIVKNLSLNVDYFGFIHFDNNMRLSIKNREVLLEKYPNSTASIDIFNLADNIINSKNKFNPNSITDLMRESN